MNSVITNIFFIRETSTNIPRGIRVTALMPGAADTEIWKQFWPDAPRDKMIEPESVAQAVMYAVFLPPNANLEELLVVPVVGAL